MPASTNDRNLAAQTGHVRRVSLPLHMLRATDFGRRFCRLGECPAILRPADLSDAGLQIYPVLTHDIGLGRWVEEAAAVVRLARLVR
jgi:hypothetical protein